MDLLQKFMVIVVVDFSNTTSGILWKRLYIELNINNSVLLYSRSILLKIKFQLCIHNYLQYMFAIFQEAFLMWKSFRRILESSFNSGKSSPSKPFAAIEKINNCGLHIEVKMVFMAEKTITVPEHFLLLFLLVVTLNIFSYWRTKMLIGCKIMDILQLLEVEI